MNSPRRDPLPQLSIIRETSFMRRVFEKALSGPKIRDCSVLNVRHKPGKSCLGVLSTHDRSDPRIQPDVANCLRKILCAGSERIALRQGAVKVAGASRFGRARFSYSGSGRRGPGVPNDRKLPCVSALIDNERIAKEVVPSLLKRTLGRAMPVTSISHEMVRYIPEHGCTVK